MKYLIMLLCLSVNITLLADYARSEEQRKIVLSENQFKESYLEKVSVSGGIRAGFMYQSSLDHIDIHNLFVQLKHDITDDDAMLCVNMVSRDGRYSASWAHALGKQPAGSISVNLPSKYQEKISSYSPEGLVVLASIMKKDCTASETKYYVATGWGNANSTDYILYVNSGNTDTFIGIPGSGQKIQCSKITNESTIAYDTKCIIDKNLLNEPKSIFLVRSNFGSRLPNVEFPIK